MDNLIEQIKRTIGLLEKELDAKIGEKKQFLKSIDEEIQGLRGTILMLEARIKNKNEDSLPSAVGYVSYVEKQPKTTKKQNDKIGWKSLVYAFLLERRGQKVTTHEILKGIGYFSENKEKLRNNSVMVNQALKALTGVKAQRIENSKFNQYWLELELTKEVEMMNDPL